MEKFKEVDGGICAAKGFKASGMYCGIKAAMQNAAVNDGNESPTAGKKNDIALICADVMCHAAGVFTSNKVKGEPVIVCQQSLKVTEGEAKAVIINSGNANTCTRLGYIKARKMCEMTAHELGVTSGKLLLKEEVLVASTGVIGQELPMEPIEKAVPELVKKLSYEGNTEAATAIMTTDTVKKEYAVKFTVGGKECAVGGMAKGSGMIHPNMATTLNFITTDAAVSAEMLQKALSENVKYTYNCLSVDGDQSTNDTCLLLSSGLAGNEEINAEGEDFETFKAALYQVMEALTIMLARDGEGASKLLTCVCSEAPSWEDAIAVAKSIIKSPLVKCAMFGADANCGRILCAAGYADTDCDASWADVYYASKAGKIQVCKEGLCLAFDEEKAAEILAEDEIEILISLHMGEASATAWGCDLTYDYVKINGDYRS